ncbi:MAG: type II toxin-antitoxin system HicB family antitoxin [Deltaproteobacteria bacterium]|nr:type II toxin-antitoxin system HicB family antitoxin [Deltaproteobacteria bacterium]
MLSRYIKLATDSAQFELIEDEGEYWGEITGLQGVWAKADTLEECRADLQENLEEWIVFRLRHQMDMPILEGIDLNEAA